ncbi:MAG: CHAT domain-containing protein [Ardenticatenaceae bacterium]|nr:CHAT domain-containing protein [Ardenticatenaceae bacterium]
MEQFVCKISLLNLPGQNKIRITYTSLTDSVFVEDFELSALQLQTIKRLNHWINKEESCDRDDLSLIGRHLYNLLFPPQSQIRKMFEENYSYFIRTKKIDSRLRIVLIFQENIASQIANFPWEFLYKEEGKLGFFLAGQKTELILTRFVPNQDLSLEVEPLPLRILVAVSQPYELRQMDTIEVISYLERLHHKYPTQIDLRVVENPTHKELLALHDPNHPNRFLPHIFHFIGHAQLGQLALILEEEEIKQNQIELGKNISANWCDSTGLIQVFEKAPPRVVFLHAWDGATSGSLDGFRSMTTDLVHAKIPAVIAMQYRIRDRDASLFAMAFYEELSRGARVDEAVRAGRETLGNSMSASNKAWNDRRFGTPVVYLQTEEAIVLPRQEQLPPQLPTPHFAAAPAVASKVPCPNPQCDGLVRPNSMLCLKCKLELVKCENCQSLRLKDISICDICGFGYERNQPAPAQAAPEIAGRSGEQQIGGVHTSMGNPQRGSTQTGNSSKILSTRAGSGGPVG